jgi:hypothetical protein
MVSPVQARESLHPKQRELYRAAAPADKLALVGRINASLQAVKLAQLRATRPQLPAADHARELRRWWFSARD